MKTAKDIFYEVAGADLKDFEEFVTREAFEREILSDEDFRQSVETVVKAMEIYADEKVKEELAKLAELTEMYKSAYRGNKT